MIRAGYGISVDPNNFRALRDAYPAIISQQFSGANPFSAAGSLATGIPAFTAPNISQGILSLPSNVGTTTFPKNFNRGYIESDNVMVQRDLGAGFNLQTGYVGTRGDPPDSRFEHQRSACGHRKSRATLIYPVWKLQHHQQ